MGGGGENKKKGVWVCVEGGGKLGSKNENKKNAKIKAK